MPLTIPDEVLESAGLTEEEARVEFACGLFDAGKLSLWPSAKLAGMSRTEFEAELLRRGIPIYRPTIVDIEADLAALDQIIGRR